MPKAKNTVSEVRETEATSPQARFFYLGAFQLAKRREELSQPKPRMSQDKKSIRKWWFSQHYLIFTKPTSHHPIISLGTYLRVIHIVKPVKLDL